MIDDFIQRIPPAPKALQTTVMFLNQGELTKAAKIAETDPALKSYLKNIVNKPIYGFSNEVSDISQIFGILGVSSSQETVYNYMVTLLSPNKWELFKLNNATFHELQAKLSKRWEQILNHLNLMKIEYESAIALLPASILVSEALFASKKQEVELLRSTSDIDLNTILKRLCKQDIFDICEKISIKWEMPKEVAQIVQAASGVKPSHDETLNTLGKWMHLLLFYELSQEMFVHTGLNDFIEFQIDYVNDVYTEFSQLLEIA